MVTRPRAVRPAFEDDIRRLTRQDRWALDVGAWRRSGSRRRLNQIRNERSRMGSNLTGDPNAFRR
jgi:hypothetical protein